MIASPPASEDGTITSPTLLHAIRANLRNLHSSWIVPVVGLMITAAVTLYMKSSVENIANLEFISQCNEITNKITERLDDHARILLSGAALFNASETVTREEWRIFNKAQKVEKQLPGVQGIGFSLLIPRAELPRHIQKIRREGFPQYKLRPDGVREVYSSIIYLEPFSGRNLRAFGYDMLSEPVRKLAMERARDTDTAALSGKVVLVQETSTNIQAGTLIYVPVYRKGMPIETIEQRRAAIYGWVYSPYRMNDLMQGIIGDHNLAKEKQIHFQVFDGAQPSIQSLLYDSQPTGDQKLSPDARYTRQIPVDFNGQRWTLNFTQTGGGFATLNYIIIWLTLVSGIIITLLLFSLILALFNTRNKAHKTENLAAELRETKEYLENLIDYANVPIVVWNPQFHITRFNHAFETLTGRVSGDVLGNNLEILFPPDLVDSSMEHIKRTLSSEHWESLEISILHVNGSVSTVLWNSATIFAGDGITPVAIIAQGTDITERKQAEIEVIEQRNLSRKYLQIAGVMIIALNSAGEITLINRKGLDILGYQDEQELVGKNWFDIVLPKEVVTKVKLVFSQLMSGSIQPVEYYENTVLARNGEERIISFKNTTLRDKEGKILGILSSGQDITERKQAEEKTMASLREKETLLKEIHHRVKNNLQIISSLLRLQSRSIGDKKMDGIFQECQDRITAMASVHYMLYKSQNFAAIDFGEYIRETASQLFRSYKTGSVAISLVINAENVMLPIDTAIPCGLIINELVTNSLKYAFPGAEKGEIKIEMNRAENGVILLFEDNGIGFPKDVDFSKTETFGLRLVHMLVKQLDGTVEQFLNKGTRYIIKLETETA